MRSMAAGKLDEGTVAGATTGRTATDEKKGS
jgi:hypothetical protein